MSKPLLFLLLTALAASAQQAQNPELADAVAELKRVSQLLAEQQKLIQSLQQVVEKQQQRLDRLQNPQPQIAANNILPQPKPQPKSEPKPEQPAVRPKTWFERYSLGGYVQTRTNSIYASNPNLTCEQCDRTIGTNSNLSLRRARLRIAGDISPRIYMYFQTDFAVTPAGTNNHFGQIRDLYFDLAIDKKKEYRIRAGQSKVPFGFENMQSSQNRLPLDRADATNSAFVNERDLGVYFMYAPAHIRARFDHLVKSGLKGSGDYGMATFGFFNGQNANRPETNSNLHRVARITYPFQFAKRQIVETSVQTYTGSYDIQTLSSSLRNPGSLPDHRTGYTFVLYPQPFGIQAEYNHGRGPQFNPATRSVSSQNLSGGYAQIMYRQKLGQQYLTPFARFQNYAGGKKHELDARRYIVRDWEAGVEWQLSPFLELVPQYSFSDRTFEDAARPNNRQKGHLIRLQLQLNY